VKIDLAKIAEVTSPTWLEAIEIRRQVGISATALAEQLQRLTPGEDGSPPDLDPFDDLELMAAIGAALWLLARRDGYTEGYDTFVAQLTLDDLFSSDDEAPAPVVVPANRAARRAAPRARKPKAG
jgi:hypothetical protein